MLIRRERGKATKTHLVYHPSVEGNHNRVVNNQDILEVERLSVLHPALSREFAEVKIRDEDCH
jgi:hypothetical protein